MSKNKGLGRGIDALFQDLSEIEEVDIKNDQVVEIPLSDLRPNPYHCLFYTTDAADDTIPVEIG